MSENAGGVSSVIVSITSLIDLANWIGTTAVYLTGPLLVLFYVFLFGLIGGMGLFVLLPIVCPTWSLVYFIHISVGLWISFCLVFSFFMAIYRGAGKVKDFYKFPFAENMDPELAEPVHRFCSRCKYPKPERSHHCKICKQCFLKTDHHCPWICGCVGFHNHQYFLQWILYNFIACLYLTGAILLHYTLDETLSQKPLLQHAPFMFELLLCGCLSVTLLFFDGWHFFLVLTGQTTVEFNINYQMKKRASRMGEPYENPYDIGMANNYKVVFGENARWWWVLVPSFARPMGNGIVWKNRRDYLMNDYFDSKRK